MWFVFQIGLVFWPVLGTVFFWRKLGDAEYVESLGPATRTLFGIKLFTGTNGRTYAEPPPHMKRLKISLLFGLAVAAFLGGVFYWPAVWLLR